MVRRKLVPVGIALLLVLAGCAGLGSDVQPTSQNAAPGDGAPKDGNAVDLELNAQSGGGDGGSPDDGASAGSGNDGALAQVDPAQRSIIREGRMTLEVENFSSARSAVVAAARERDGWVGDSHRDLHRDGDATWRSGYVVVRIPSSEYGGLQAAVAGHGTVLDQTTETKDVTDKLVDLEARLTNLRDRRDRLRDFYDRANSTSELLEVEAELSQVQGEIERLEAEKRSLERRVAYSTLRVELREPAPDESEVGVQYHERSLTEAFLDSVGDLSRFARASLVTLAALLPWLVAAAVPVGVARAAARRGWLPRPSLRSRLPDPGAAGGDDAPADGESGATESADEDQAEE